MVPGDGWLDEMDDSVATGGLFPHWTNYGCIFAYTWNCTVGIAHDFGDFGDREHRERGAFLSCIFDRLDLGVSWVGYKDG